MTIKKIGFCLLPLVAALAACGDSGSSGDKPLPPPPPVACIESGEYACKTGETEPLYTFQWALNYLASYFKDFPEVFGKGMDLNIEPVHRQGINGQGVK